MKTLETLVKLATRKVEEQQQEIARLLDVIQQMTKREQVLKAQIITETDHAAGDPALLQHSELFRARASAERADIADAQADAAKILADKRATLTTLFAEQKRYETLLQRKMIEHRKNQQKQEQRQLDEVASRRQG